MVVKLQGNTDGFRAGARRQRGDDARIPTARHRHDDAVIDADWPSVDEAALVRNSIEMVVQVNGKVRAKIEVAADADADTVKTLAREQENVQRFLDGLTIRKEILVPKKLVNIVAN